MGAGAHNPTSDVDVMPRRTEAASRRRGWRGSLGRRAAPGRPAVSAAGAGASGAAPAVTAVALGGVLGAPVAGAGAALPFPLPLFFKPAPAPVLAPVADPISADPLGGFVRGTMIMIHAGGWAGHDAHAQDVLMTTPGALLLQRGWRVVSIDCDEGVEGLQDILNAAGSELARRSGDGPLCLYGESAGAHLALVAASRLRAVDCVVGLGPPTDLALSETDGSASADAQVRLIASRMSRFFGTAAAEIASWDLVSLAPRIHADVLLMREGDDVVVPAIQSGREQYATAIGSLADRAVSARDAARSASRTGCAQVARSIGEVGLAALQNALRWLAHKDVRSLPAAGAWHQTTVTMRGEVSAARIWASLRRTRSGRRALAATATRRAKVAVLSGDRSRVTLRDTRGTARVRR